MMVLIRTKKQLFFLVLILSQITMSSFASDYKEIGVPLTEIFNEDQHKGTGQNWWLVQGDNGYIYNGTGSGLSEWDGEQWRLYQTPNKTLIRSASKWIDGRIYVGTTNDIGYYHSNEKGILTYYSLLDNWSFEQRQFGQVWSTAANQNGVIFVTRKLVLFWNGTEVKIVPKAAVGQHRIFALKNHFIYKLKGEPFLYKISQSLEVIQTQFTLPKDATAYLITKNRNDNIVAFTSRHGLFEQQDQRMQLRVDSDSLGNKVRVYNGIQASDGYYYVATLRHGLFILTEDFKLVRQYTEKHGLGGDKIYSILEDRQNNIWLSGVPNIVKMIPPHIYSRYQSRDKIVLPNDIGLFQNKITVAAHGFHQLSLNASHIAPASFQRLPDIDGAKWDFLEYENHFVYAGEGGVFARKIVHGILSDKSQKLGTTNVGKALAIDPITNKLFAATNDGLFTITFKNGKWQSEVVEGSNDELRVLAIDDKGIVWTGTETNELYRIENAQFPEKETKIQKFTNDLGTNDVLPYKLSSGLVIGTSDGLMNYQADRESPLQFVSGYPQIFATRGQEINRLFEDNDHRLWYRIEEHAGYIEKDKQGIWQNNEEIFKALPKNGYKGFVSTTANILWFVSSKGEVYRLNIDLMITLPKSGILNIRQVLNLNNDKEISGGLNTTNFPQLDQQNNSIRIVYALAENANANPAQYRHKLLGSRSETWSPWTSETHKDFTHLSGSDYQFMLEAKDGWDRVSTTKLSFSVLPPWYLSGIAWLTYVIIFLSLLILSGWLTQRWRTAKLQQANENLERKVAERTKEVQTKARQLKQQQVLKDRFFSNVSHEFRTPLTLVMMPLQDLLRSHPNLESSITHPVESALRSSQKMLDLVAQILDVNRLESGQFPLNIAEYDIANLINLMVSRFRPWSEQNQQILTAEEVSDPTLIYCDQDQIDKCVSNLISNAIKYSGEKSQITVSIVNNSEEDFIGIEVKDNGCGISKHSENKVFERFYQDEQSEQITEPGTGIGLSLVKELVSLHHGRVELMNKPNEGCRFIIWLLRGCEHFSESNFIEPNQLAPLNKELTYFPKKLESSKDIEGTNGEEEKYDDITTILIVDDNDELRHFVALRLSTYYRIIQASNGQEGLAMANTELPDLIISDVMMPIKNGMEMIKEIKNNPETNGIPIILLTAKSTKRETVEGLQSGADDYLTKPFDTSELIVRIGGLIESRKALRLKIEAELSELNVTDNLADNNKSERSFKEQLKTEILNQITKPDFSIDNIAKALALGRRSLDRKCQQEIHQSIGHYITEIRMQSAFQLLNGQNHNVSEVAYATGYESLAYFSRTFKAFFGHSPSLASQTSK